MSAKTGIEWTDSTWNPIRGVNGRHHCTKISPGCQNCYAAAMNKRFSGLDYVKGADTFRLDEKALNEPLKWTPPRRVFVCSMTDLFHEELPMEFIVNIFDVMASATADCGKHHQHEAECWTGSPHIFQILTKRPARMLEVIKALPDEVGEHFPGDSAINVAMETGNWPLKNVWLGVTAENQQYADERIPLLLQTPAAVRFVSYEPALGPIDFRRYFRHDTQAKRGVCLSGSSIGRLGNQGRRNDLEAAEARLGSVEGTSSEPPMSTDPSRTQCRPLPPGQGDDRREKGLCASPQAGLPTFQGTDSTRSDGQPRERQDDGQQAGESHTGHAFGADLSLSPCPGNGAVRQSERRGEPCRETDAGRYSDDPATPNRRRTTESNRAGFRNQRQGGVEDRQRGQVGLDLVICGGESGHKARPMHPDWARSVRDQCQAAGVPFFFKQWGEWCPWQNSKDLAHLLPSQQILISPNGRIERQVKGFTNLPEGPPSATYMGKVGKKAAGRLLDGREWSEFPKVIA